MPDGTGIELVGELREANPEVSILVLTVSRDREVHLWASKLGANGVITKESSLPQIVATIKRLGDVGETRDPDDAGVPEEGERRSGF